ncbi:hypothetical protein N2K95_04800 [Arthrobacter zhaoxinii]|uniref:Ribosomally synthesized peptide with SipW-like signal peptide n=1 Tax=Arthrobacter zhaoxinii TaxID=2964616 RepID=A0ABY5YV97_9MICC|nr:hypothetical protein [Arthrobacter zhaoxinii]UWX97993.1 hypothetical protein N2K95_04800 [Arthrobacter zhaoxinii]
MNSLRSLKAAGLILAAVVLGLMTVQGSYALWNTIAPSNAGTIQAADFRIDVNNVEMTPTFDFPVGQLSRGGKAVKYFEVKNSVNVTAASPLRIQASLAGLGPVKGFDGHLTVTAAAVAAGTNCDTLAPNRYTPVSPAPVLAKGAPQGICLKAELSPSTPSAYLGRDIASTVTLNVAQTAPVK